MPKTLLYAVPSAPVKPAPDFPATFFPAWIHLIKLKERRSRTSQHDVSLWPKRSHFYD